MTSRRIEELTDKLTEWQRVFGFIEPNEALDDYATQLATERTAREQAEKRAEDWQVWCQSANRDNAALEERARRAERERDTVLARVKELENDLEIANQHFRARVAELEAAESALASAQHRIAELEAYGNDCCARAISGAVGNHLHRIAQLESALASARELPVAIEKEVARTGCAASACCPECGSEQEWHWRSSFDAECDRLEKSYDARRARVAR